MLGRRAFLAAGLAPLVGACSTAALPAAAPSLEPLTAADAQWSTLGVEGLEALVAAAWANHPDVEAALASAQLARAAATRARAESQPLLLGTAQNSRSRQGGSRSSSFNAGLEGSWDLDIAGTLAKELEAAKLRVQAQSVLVRAARTALACEVVAALLSAAVEDKRRSWAQRYLALTTGQREVLELKLSAGLVSKQEVTSARAAEAAALRLARRVDGERAEAMARLQSLVGGDATENARVVSAVSLRGLPRFTMPSSLIDGKVWLQRPDLQAAELECQAVSVELAATERARLPKVNLGALLGVAATSVAGLASTGVVALTLSQAVQWKVFDGGRWAADVEYSRANERVAAARYRQKAWAAMQETATALLRYQLAVEEVDASRASLGLVEEARRVTQSAREGGLVDALATLEAERALLDTEALSLESAQLLAGTMGRVLAAAAGPLPGLTIEFVADSRL